MLSLFLYFATVLRAIFIPSFSSSSESFLSLIFFPVEEFSIFFNSAIALSWLIVLFFLLAAFVKKYFMSKSPHSH